MTQQTNLGLVWAKNGGVTPVDNTKYESGWVAEIPTYQNFNYQVQTTDKNILKYAEEGVYDWEAIISYKPGARVIVAGKRYTCKANALNKNPTTDTSGSFWVEGWLVGNSFTGLRKTDGSKIELAVRPNRDWTGQDQTIVNLNPMTAYVTTDTSKNWAISNVDGEMTVVDLGTTSGSLSPNGANLVKGAGKTFRLYHEGFKPTVSDVAGGVEEAPADGKYYARVGLSGTSGQWVKVTTNQVSATRPKPAVGSGMGWYNLEDGTYYIDIFDGDTSQWVPASPPMIPIRDASGIGFEPKTSGLGDNVQTAIERVNNSKLDLSDIQESTGNSYVYPMSQQSVTSALGSYKQQAISIAALDATAKVDAVEVGGRNLIEDSRTIIMNGSDTGNGGVYSSVVEDYFMNSPPDNGNSNNLYNFQVLADNLYAGKEYLVSVQVNTTSSGGIYFRAAQDVTFSFPNTVSEWKTVTYKIVANADYAKGSLFLVGAFGLTFGNTYKFRKWQLVEGNKATDWTPAPEDVEAHAENYTDTAITNLGLGTASTHDVGESASQLMPNGAWGVGGIGKWYGSAFGGFYKYAPSLKPTNLPSGTYEYGTVYKANHGYGGNSSEICIPHLSDGGMLFRAADTMPWRTTYHSGNQYSLGATKATAKAALDIKSASTTTVGMVKLNSTLTSTSTTEAATASTVKTLKDAVDAAQAAVNGNQASTSSATAATDVSNTHTIQVNTSVNSNSTGTRSQVNSSLGATASGTATQVNCSDFSVASGTGAQVNASHTCTSSGNLSQVNASTNSTAGAAASQVNASRLTVNNSGFSTVWGHTLVGGSASTANQKIRLESESGVGRFKGNIATGGFDYAEYFPNLNKGVIPNGTIVTLSEDKVKPAQEGDFILGVVSGTSGIIGNSAEFCWHKRHLVDEFGVTITEDKEMVSFGNYYGLVSECTKDIPNDAKHWIGAVPVENPDYIDISSEYQTRGERKEDWSIIGLMGQVFVRTSEQLVEGDYVSSSGSKSTEETRLRVMKMTTDFDLDKGYGVAFCLIR